MSTYGSHADSSDDGVAAYAGGSFDGTANPVGAYVTGLGTVIVLVAVFLPWVTLETRNNGTRTITGFEAASIIVYIGYVGITLTLALLYATSRADHRQHRGLSLVSMAVGLAWVLFAATFYLDPTVVGPGEDTARPDYGLLVSLVGGIIWAIGSFVLAREPEGDHQASRNVPTPRHARQINIPRQPTPLDDLHRATLRTPITHTPVNGPNDRGLLDHRGTPQGDGTDDYGSA